MSQVVSVVLDLLALAVLSMNIALYLNIRRGRRACPHCEAVVWIAHETCCLLNPNND